ncbi:hypothetical protein [Nonomuraea sp. 10N515B]|uniref:hypothetical protein n=1 Tax=Nonomuraea sp. 10N515B TaxID=3457422 RepID=UPI003FCC3614
MFVAVQAAGDDHMRGYPGFNLARFLPRCRGEDPVLLTVHEIAYLTTEGGELLIGHQRGPAPATERRRHRRRPAGA